MAYANSKAELQKQMETAQNTIAALSSQAEFAEYDLLTVENEIEETNALIDELNSQIPETQGELDVVKGELAHIVADSYKNGTPTLLDVFLNTVSLDDLVLRIEYANKVAQYKRGVIDEVKGLTGALHQQIIDLEVQRASKEELLAQHQQRLEAVRLAVEAAETYYAGLSEELQQMIAAEQAAQQAAAEAAARAASANAQRAAAAIAAERARQSAAAASGAAGEESQVAGDAAPIELSPEEISGIYSNVPGVDYAPFEISEDVITFVTNAFTIVGGGYSWSGYNWTGNTFTSTFTCSGVIDFARGFPARTNSPESLYEEVGSRMVFDTSLLNFGDLVFYAYADRYPTGHVGIYIGDGQIIDSVPNGGVTIHDVNYMTFVGGGPIY
jgi:peptidoglycan hydrolase CwlO-like protein